MIKQRRDGVGPRGDNGSAARRSKHRTPAWLMAAALAWVAAPGAARSGAYNPDNLPADQAGAVDQVCRSVIRVQPGEEHYDNCVESLSDSLRSLDHGRAIGRARADCLGKGLEPGSADLAVCEWQGSGGARAGATSRPAAPATGASSAAAEPGGGRSYFAASPQEARRREALACAEVGFDPAGGGFESCVASLQSALFAADNPMN